MDDLERYSRQMRFAGFGPSTSLGALSESSSRNGEEAQRRLRASRVALVGCGALGSVSSSLLVRAGVGELRLIDRDFVELNNLQRQMLFDEDDARLGLPKAEAARRKLARVNSEVKLDARIVDLNPANAESLLSGVDLILDAADNFETRYLVNDVAVKTGTPWIYAAALGSEGRVMTILPGETPCLRCIFPDVPRPGESPTCETAGILGPAVAVTASLQSAEAMKLLAGRRDVLRRGLLALDVWQGGLRETFVSATRREDCPACALRRFEFLEGAASTSGVKLCGRNAVHVSPSAGVSVDLAALAARLDPASITLRTDFLLRFQAEGREITVFSDGRAIVKGTSDPVMARSLYAKHVGA